MRELAIAAPYAFGLERNILPDFDSLALLDDLADFLVETLSVDTRGHG